MYRYNAVQYNTRVTGCNRWQAPKNNDKEITVGLHVSSFGFDMLRVRGPFCFNKKQRMT